MRLGFAFIIMLVISTLSNAETINTTDGHVVEGKIIEKTAKSIKVDVDGVGVMTYYSDEIKDIDGQPFMPVPQNLPVILQDTAQVNTLPNPSPDNDAQNLDKVNALYQAKDYGNELVLLNSLIEANPKNALLYAGRGACLVRKHENSDALKDYLMAKQLDPGNIQLNKSLGYLYLTLQNGAQAQTYFNWYLQAYPKDGEQSMD